MPYGKRRPNPHFDDENGMSTLERIAVRVPQPLIDKAEELATRLRIKRGALYREIWLAGLPVILKRYADILGDNEEAPPGT